LNDNERRDLGPGSSLAHYRITAKLGEGGMGEVWSATDTRLDREVAIKVLPAAFTEDKERLARFEREAKLLAQLNHPNIAQIYGLESSGATHALVMELVPGPTLAERLESGPLPFSESVSFALQIAQALEEAHEKGIVHRDLKPQNIKASSEGKAKVLDFGLAKAMEAAPGSASATDLARSPTLMNSPTLTAVHGTQLGIILGTAAYMAPEQARGAAVDKRADIWAFGVLLYEMLTGERLFEGDSVVDTLSAVMRKEIDLGRLPAGTPGVIRQLLRRCLERNPKRRLHDIADARIVLEDVLAGVDVDERGAPVGRAQSRTPGRTHLTWLAGLLIAVAGTALLTRFAGEHGAAPGEPQRLAIHLANDQELAIGGNSLLTFSPDGRSLVFAVMEKGRRAIYRRELGQRDAERIEGTEDGEAPFFSPDGRSLGFVARGQVMKVAAAGGRPVRIGEARGAGGATWLDDGTIVLAPIYSDGLFRMTAEGANLTRLTTPDRDAGVLGHWWPDEVPGGRWVLFTAFRTPVDTSRVGAVDLTTGEVRWLVEGGFFGRYLATGHLLYAKGQRLYAVPFDAATATVGGAAVTVLDDLLVEQTGGFAMLAVSRRGTLAYVSESLGHLPTELVWLDRAGIATPAATERRRYLTVGLSPDGRRAALTVQGESRDLWVLSFDRGTLSRLTSGDDTEFDPTWTPDGNELIYVVDRPPFELHRIAAGAPDSGRPVWNEPAELDHTTPVVAPDGRTVVYSLTEEGTGTNLYARPFAGGEPRALRASRGQELYASFSADGRWLAYESDETGRPEIYVEAFPGPGERVQVSADGGRQPRWAANGELFYRHDDELRVVVTRFDGRFAFEPPRSLFRYPIKQSSSGGTEAHLYDVSADGRRLLAITTPETLRPRQIDIVTEWTTELVRLMSGGKP
jgi:serine/threonine-protein kinase